MEKKQTEKHKKKGTIQKTKPILASDYMLAMAESEDVIRISSYYSYEKYSRNVYYRVRKEKNHILKIALYQVKPMKLGAKMPRLEVYLDYKHFKYKTWDYVKKKWSSATLEHLVCYQENMHTSDYWISEADTTLLRQYLDISEVFSKNPETMITYWQRNILQKKRMQDMKKEVEPWDKAMKKVRSVPKDFDDWLLKNVIKEHFVFYEYSRKGAKEGYCSRCKHTVSVENPKHNQKGICPHCKALITYRSIGKHGRFLGESRRAYLFQKYEDGIILRCFEVFISYQKEKYKEPKICSSEYRRYIYDTEGEMKAHYWFGMYRNHHVRWQKVPIQLLNVSNHYYRWYGYSGKTYQRNLYMFKGTFLEKSGFLDFNKKNPLFEPYYYFCAVRQIPLIEKLVKAGLETLAVDYMYDIWKEDRKFTEANSLAKCLMIDNARMKRLRELNGGYRVLEWFQYEKACDRVIEDEVIHYFNNLGIVPEQLKVMRKHMKERKIMNFLKKQMKMNPKLSAKEILQMYEDYYFVSKGIKRNMNLELFYKPKDLKKEHDEVVALSKGKDIAKRAGEIISKFPNVENVCHEIKNKYEFRDEEEGYAILVPESVEDIVHEGRTLRHCVDSYDAYFDRIERQETYIVFLRKIDAIDTPYYTLEIEPCGTARQKRTTNDNQNEDIEDAKAFICKWQKQIQKNMTLEDQKLAQTSKKLRISGYKEMRKNEVKIRNGKLKGKLLADVLEADLMEAAMCS